MDGGFNVKVACSRLSVSVDDCLEEANVKDKGNNH